MKQEHGLHSLPDALWWVEPAQLWPIKKEHVLDSGAEALWWAGSMLLWPMKQEEKLHVILVQRKSCCTTPILTF
jgi:hypothetical protein